MPHPIPFRPEVDKITRMHAQSAKIEAGHVLLPRQAVWLEDLGCEPTVPNGERSEIKDTSFRTASWSRLDENIEDRLPAYRARRLRHYESLVR